MDNDDLFDIIEPADNQDNTAKNPADDFVQGENFVNSLDFANGFSDANEEEIEKILNEANDILADNTEISAENELENVDLGNVDVSGGDAASTADISESVDNIENSADETGYTDDVSTNDIFDVQDTDIADNNDASSEDSEDDDMSDDDFIDDEDYEQAMIITEGTVITGSINTDCSLDIYGTVNGDVFCEGKLSITGKVIGNSHATEVMINAHRVEGNIECQGVVKVGQNSVIIGDITAGAAVIAGAVKGTLDVQGPVILDSTAVIKGNIKAKSVQLINGAVLEGFCSLEYANSNVDEIFN